MRERAQQVVVEADAGADVRQAAAVQDQLDADVGLAGRPGALDRRASRRLRLRPVRFGLRAPSRRRSCVDDLEQTLVLGAAADGEAQVAAQRVGRPEGARHDPVSQQPLRCGLGGGVVADPGTSRKLVTLG